MSQENVEIVRRSYEHRQTGGDFLPELTAPDYVWDMTNFRGWPEQQTYEGLESARQFIREWTAAFHEWQTEVVAIHDAGDDRVVAVIHMAGRATLSGVETQLRYAVVCTLRDRKIARAEAYDDPAEALKAVGLEE